MFFKQDFFLNMLTIYTVIYIYIFYSYNYIFTSNRLKKYVNYYNIKPVALLIIFSPHVVIPRSSCC